MSIHMFEKVLYPNTPVPQPPPNKKGKPKPAPKLMQSLWPALQAALFHGAGFGVQGLGV